ncbi:MAG: ATP-binding protein [Planctomycetes bacterium]|nr:ATP-binding protein [Planctomycetota bacterium]
MEMTEAELLALVEAGEGKTLEFKRGVQRGEKLARTLAAFANTRGGILLVGIGDDGALLGAPRPRESARALVEIAAELVEPTLTIEVSIVRALEKAIVCCSVPLSGARPHAVVRDDGTREIVVRAGSSNRAAGERAIAEMRVRPRAFTELELAVLAWVGRRTAVKHPATPDDFAQEHGIGKQRARNAFGALERAGKLVAHGVGVLRTYRTG